MDTTLEFRKRVHRHAIAQLAADLQIRDDDAKKEYEFELAQLGGARIKDFVPILATKRVRKNAARRLAA